MATPDTSNMIDILSTFTAATSAALTGLPESNALHPASNGISLLDTKNEIFLAYIQALALRNLNVIRSIKAGGDSEAAQELSAEITKQLVEQRVYLERGVKPLEQRIKYQVDKVVRAADEAERAAAQKVKAEAVAASKAEKEDDSESDDDVEDEQADGMAFRPSAASVFQSDSKTRDAASDRKKASSDGVYRPPRIAATAMPTAEQRNKKAERSRPHRSAAVDEYISTELSQAPLAEPSIGSTITGSGRGTKDARQLAREEERRVYEETNLVRLPKESKKDQAKRGGRERGGYGGDEWKGLGQSLNRIADLTRRKGGRDSALEKSRKRRVTEDGPRDSGMGEAFDMKARRMAKKAKR
ncbi:Hypothetical protein R9X50_00774600 [Acrodontium crateriforme]|uniref:Uncharacterized protein n=1 Tax=Acrodontium crateriforme TaxID=150365 RepID=A0AAQ3MAN0_9PEZI|nr:Hypothetical protein R9X50_00774600 [Acrodontium crateriforme]